MPEGGLPYVIIAVVAAVLIAVTVVLARLAWRRQVRRYIVGLVGRKEAVVAALRAVDGIVRTLSQGTATELVAFAGRDSADRNGMAELGSRMRVEAAELADLPLPKKLWTLADRLGDAASVLGREASRVGESEGEAALDALADFDLAPAREALAATEAEIARLAEAYDLTDPSVYGGGLYI